VVVLVVVVVVVVVAPGGSVVVVVSDVGIVVEVVVVVGVEQDAQQVPVARMPRQRPGGLIEQRSAPLLSVTRHAARSGRPHVDFRAQRTTVFRHVFGSAARSASPFAARDTQRRCSFRLRALSQGHASATAPATWQRASSHSALDDPGRPIGPRAGARRATATTASSASVAVSNAVPGVRREPYPALIAIPPSRSCCRSAGVGRAFRR
jgi:hypothetical protein